MPWSSTSDIAFSHGTDSIALASYTLPSVGNPIYDSGRRPFRPDLTKCRTQTDFGRGFYMTSSLRQAREWANEVVLKSVAKGSTASQAIVLRFVLSRELIATADSHSFVSETLDYYDFTDWWRGAVTGTLPHGRSTTHEWVDNSSITNLSKTAYDFVHGPVRLNRQHIILQNCDQLSLHTEKACDAIREVLLEAIAPPGTATSPSAFAYP